MHLHHLEKKYGIRINLLDWSGDDYETGTLNALIKIEGTQRGPDLVGKQRPFRARSLGGAVPRVETLG